MEEPTPGAVTQDEAGFYYDFSSTESVTEACDRAAQWAKVSGKVFKVYKLVEIAHYGPLGKPTEDVP